MCRESHVVDVSPRWRYSVGVPARPRPQGEPISHGQAAGVRAQAEGHGGKGGGRGGPPESKGRHDGRGVQGKGRRRPPTGVFWGLRAVGSVRVSLP